MDMVLVLDGEQHMNACISMSLLDTLFTVSHLQTRLDICLGLVVFRKEWSPEDNYKMQQLTKSFEEIDQFLEGMDSYMSGSCSTDWASGFETALHDIHWRDGVKCIFWVSPTNAHGEKFCGVENLEQEERLVGLVREAASRGIHFRGVNIRRCDDRGCERTLREIKSIYDDAGNNEFGIHEAVIEMPGCSCCCAGGKDKSPDRLTDEEVLALIQSFDICSCDEEYVLSEKIGECIAKALMEAMMAEVNLAEENSK